MASSTTNWIGQMTPEDKQLYVELGQRISAARKALDLTQTQVAEELGISQQTMAHYEGGRLRIAIATIVPLAEVLDCSLDELVYGSKGTKEKKKAAKRGPTSKLQKQVEQIGLMPRSKQKFIIEMLDALIKQQQAS